MNCPKCQEDTDLIKQTKKTDHWYCYYCCKGFYVRRKESKKMKKLKMAEFEGEVLRGDEFYEVVDEYGNGLTELKGILKPFKNKKVYITIQCQTIK